MNKRPPATESRKKTILFFIAFTFASVACLKLMGQTNCQVPPQNPNHGGWAQNSGVTYSTSSDANATEQSQIGQAFSSWNRIIYLTQPSHSASLFV